MPKKNDDLFSSRSERRKKSSFDRFLNWAIGIVVVLIVVVGAYLLFNILNSPDTSASTDNGNQKTAQKQTNKQDTLDTSNSDQSAKDTSESSDGNTVVSNNDNTDAEDQQSSNDAESGDTGGPQGPWEPVGTDQKEPHQTNYDKGSVDWNERLHALSYATGIPEDNMTLVWLGNGGAADKSLGKVKENGTSKVYDVILQWVPEKGWKPISVDVEGEGN